MNLDAELMNEGIKRIVKDLNATITRNGGKKGSFYVLIACATHEDTDHSDEEPTSSSIFYSTNVDDPDFMSDILDDFYESHVKESRIMQSKRRKAELGDTFIENWIS